MLCSSSLFLFLVLHIFFQPLVLLPKGMQYPFPAPVAVELFGKQYQSDDTSVSFDGGIQPFALNRKCTRVFIIHAMGHEQGRLDLIGISERRHSIIHLLRLPVRTRFTLEAKRR